MNTHFLWTVELRDRQPGTDARHNSHEHTFLGVLWRVPTAARRAQGPVRLHAALNCHNLDDGRLLLCGGAELTSCPAEDLLVQPSPSGPHPHLQVESRFNFAVLRASTVFSTMTNGTLFVALLRTEALLHQTTSQRAPARLLRSSRCGAARSVR
eukprot:685666-Rhodomonas_salina.3